MDKQQFVKLSSLFAILLLIMALTPNKQAHADVSKMYWVNTSGNSIYQANSDGTNEQDVSGTGTINGLRGIEVDSAAGKRYWTNFSGNAIFRSNFDGSSPEDVSPVGLVGPVGIALDVVAGRMYWTHTNTGTIFRANLDGSNPEDITPSGGIVVNPAFITLDTNAGKMYWTDFNVTIYRADLDGSNPEDITPTGITISQPLGLALDLASSKMYWTDNTDSMIYRADLDGSNPEDITPLGGVANGPLGLRLDVAAGQMYWTNVGENTIYRANLDGSNPEDITPSGVGSVNFPYDIALDLQAAVDTSLIVDRGDDPDPITANACADAIPNDCSLRGAILNSNTDTGNGYLITFDPAVTTVTLSRGGTGEEANDTGDLDILDDLTITGNGANNTIIDGANIDRVFDIRTAGLTAIFNGVTIQNGDGGNNSGSGIYSWINSDVVINNSRLTTNRRFAIFNRDSGTITINNSTIDGNGRFGENGGAILNYGSFVDINNSTISNNLGHAGAVLRTRYGGTTNIDNSTISGNSVGNVGGAIFMFGAADINIRNSSFVNNQSVNGGGAIVSNGTVNIQNSILTNNIAGVAGTNDCDGTGFGGSNNLIDDNASGACSTISSAAVTNFDATLQDNGGLTWTHALLIGSNAVDTGVGGCLDHNNNPLTSDQRGVARPQNGTCDIGAYELVAAIVPSTNSGDGPGGVGSISDINFLNMWFSAEDNAFTDNTCTPGNEANDGNSIGCWENFAIGAGNYTQNNAANYPTYQADMLNGLAVLEFDGVSDRISDNILDQSTDISLFFVVNANGLMSESTGLFASTLSNTTNNSFQIDTGGINNGCNGEYRFLGRDNTGTPFSVCAGTLDTTPRILSFVVDSGTINTYSGGALQNSQTESFVPYITNNLLARNRNNNNYFNGNIAENINYLDGLTDVQRILVENYLSSKYDIAISNDRYVGDTNSNGDFDFDVAGIGQEDISGNQHMQAHAAGMIVRNNTFLQDNGDWLLFGHRTPINSNVTTDLPSGSDWGGSNEQRWDRHYYIDVTDEGTTGGTVDLIFDFSEGGMDNNPLLMPSEPVSNYRLLKRTLDTGDFTDITAVSGATVVIVGDQVQFLGVDVDELGSNFTLGTLNAVDSPTAVTLQSFSVNSQSLSFLIVLVIGILMLGLGSLWLRSRKQ